MNAARDRQRLDSASRLDVLSRSLAEWITAGISRGETGHQALVHWAHATAVLRHAELHGLIDERIGPAGAALQDGRAAVSWIRGATQNLADAHPALAGFADPNVNQVFTEQLSEQHGSALLDPWRSEHRAPPLALAGPSNGWDGHRLGDLYQELSFDAHKNRALVQTPRFVTELLLRCTLDKADHVGAGHPTLIDPACGTGHILLETFIKTWSRGCETDESERAAAALNAVHGVDLDGYATAVAGYRLLAMASCVLSGRPLTALPRDLPIHLGQANSLLDEHPLLVRGRYDTVVSNPPYITSKDRAVTEAIRRTYPLVCRGRFSLAVPFAVLLHDLARPGGWVGQLTANSFMKREFGRPLIENFLANIDLRWVIDTSGAYIPGHGTPTVILISRQQPPRERTVRSVLGKRGEPAVPGNPAQGHVWSAIRDAVFTREARDEFDEARAQQSASALLAQLDDLLRRHEPTGVIS